MTERLAPWTAPRKMRPPWKQIGGKAYTARRIISLFPDHDVYVEPFVGAGSVVLNKLRSQRTIVNDLNPAIANAWRVMADHPEVLLEVLRAIPYTAAQFQHMQYGDLGPETPMLGAVREIVLRRFSRSGLKEDFASSERLRGKKHPDGELPGDEAAWRSYLDEFLDLAGRMGDLDVRNADACDVIRWYDGRRTLHYVDPPYLHTTRTTKDLYDEYEMTIWQHIDLLRCLLECRGAVVLSGYPSELYDAALRGWRRIEIEIANHSGQGKAKQRRIEVLWLNYEAGGALVRRPRKFWCPDHMGMTPLFNGPSADIVDAILNLTAGEA